MSYQVGNVQFPNALLSADKGCRYFRFWVQALIGRQGAGLGQ